MIAPTYILDPVASLSTHEDRPGCTRCPCYVYYVSDLELFCETLHQTAKCEASKVTKASSSGVVPGPDTTMSAL